jgi:hypothetical protein
MLRSARMNLRVGQKLGAIDEIAFQTNLLALNAGVRRRARARLDAASRSWRRKSARSRGVAWLGGRIRPPGRRRARRPGRRAEAARYRAGWRRRRQKSSSWSKS